MDLDAHRGEHRLFLIFAASPLDDGFVRQDRLLADSGGSFAERDLLRGDLFEDGTGSLDGAAVSRGEAGVARDRFGVEAGSFVALLVGKDGTVKHRSGKPVEPREIFSLVDAMPMRRRELRERRET